MTKEGGGSVPGFSQHGLPLWAVYFGSPRWACRDFVTAKLSPAWSHHVPFPSQVLLMPDSVCFLKNPPSPLHSFLALYFYPWDTPGLSLKSVVILYSFLCHMVPFLLSWISHCNLSFRPASSPCMYSFYCGFAGEEISVLVWQQFILSSFLIWGSLSVFSTLKILYYLCIFGIKLTWLRCIVLFIF